MMLDFDEYRKLKEQGKTAGEACLMSLGDGLSPLGCMQMLTNVYQLSPTEAKEVMVKQRHGCNSLDEFQKERILPMLKEFFKSP